MLLPTVIALGGQEICIWLRIFVCTIIVYLFFLPTRLQVFDGLIYRRLHRIVFAYKFAYSVDWLQMLVE